VNTQNNKKPQKNKSNKHGQQQDNITSDSRLMGALLDMEVNIKSLLYMTTSSIVQIKAMATPENTQPIFQNLLDNLQHNNINLLTTRRDLSVIWDKEFHDKPMLKLTEQQHAAIDKKRKKEEELDEKKREEKEADRLRFEELVKCTKEVYDAKVKAQTKQGKKALSWREKKKIIKFLEAKKQIILADGTLQNLSNVQQQSGG
jgi:hypothetical protein